MVKVKILGLTFSQVQAGAYALILAEEGGTRRVPVIVGTAEAQSITIHLEGHTPPRPLTHDLFVIFMGDMDARIKQVYINHYENGVFHSQIFFEKTGRTFTLDARTSDAIALAIRCDAPIYIAEEIINNTAISHEEEYFWEEDAAPINKKTNLPLESLQPEELQRKLKQAIAREDFEKASYLRDLIDRRRTKK
jgi:bifunctional DNase/RNase